MRRLAGILVFLCLTVAAGAAAGAVGGALAARWVLTREAALSDAPSSGASASSGSPGARAGAAGGAPGDSDTAANAPSGGAASRDASGEESIVAAVRATRPAVVTVMNLQAVRANMFAPVSMQQVASGSGVIFDARGYLATNAHVIEGAAAVEVVFVDGQRVPAEVVRWDRAYDVAILRLAPEARLPAAAPLADSSALAPGMQVLAIGSPLGTEYQNTVTTGIVAGLNRRVKDMWFDRRTFQFREFDVVDVPLIQTDAAINTGNSGGPLVNLRGEVVGLNTLIVRSDKSGRSLVEGLGFAVPSNVVRGLADEWIDSIPRADLGAELVHIDPAIARQNNLSRGTGAIVTAVREGGPAAAAGLRRGDIIAAVDDAPLDLDRAFDDLIWRYRAGDTARLTVDRQGVEVALDLTFGAPEAAGGAAGASGTP